jgi:phosphohistidine swiveling domain-containing protein
MDALVLDLAAIDSTMLPLVGGKAANLGELIRAGLPVPGGFCLTVHAYRQVAELAEVDALLERETADRDARGHELAGKARTALLATRVPQDLADEVARAYSALDRATDPGVPVAVRSSATAEDLPFASFAGQQDTYLNVIGADAVLDAVRRCWASLWTDRAVSYRANAGISHREVALAVVVQRLVHAEVSGVLFTANPVTNRRREAVIEASPGLGEAVVSGAVNPDRFVVGLDAGEVRERRLGDKRLVIRPVASGGTIHLTREPAPAPCLTDAQLRELASLGRKVEDDYGAPRDCEWALDADGAMWLTQSRPITTLYPLPNEPGPPDDGSSVYFCATLAQGLVRPLTPLGLSAFRVLGSGLAELVGVDVPHWLDGPPRLEVAGQRLFVDVTPALTHPLGRRILLLLLGVMEARAAEVLRRLGEDPRFGVRRVSPVPLVRTLAGVAWRLRVPLKVLEAVASPRWARGRIRRFGDQLAARLVPPAGATDEQRLDHVLHALHDEVSRVMPRTAPAAGAGFLLLAVAARLLGGALRPGDLAAVLRGLPHNVTTEMDLELWALARRVDSDPMAAAVLRAQPAAELARRYRRGELPSVAQAGMAAFLDRYGHRAVAEIDLGVPRWSEDPTQLFGMLTNYLRLDNLELAPDRQFARAEQSATEAVRRLVRRARRRARWRGWLVSFALRRARELVGLREVPKYYLVLGLASVRRVLAEVGAELVLAGRLTAAEDVEFLRLAEIRRALRGELMSHLAEFRRGEYQLELRRRQVPRVLLSDGTEPEAVSMAPAAGGTDGRLTGVPASSGSVTGLARVVLDPVGARLEPGEVLVAPSTDPGWTPLFLTAGGLVMEMGGANSHGAVVAREYGIPAVVGVPAATQRIHNGQRLQVNGADGSVTLL